MDSSALPAVKAAFDEAIAEVRLQVQRLGGAAFIPEPWLGDPISSTTRAHYNSVVMESAEGAYSAMVAYADELIRIRDSLQAMQDQYLSSEDQAAGDMRRQQA
ncbi:hypothetical protein [Pseudonocardia hierapolitana]|uniref:hypothetical protein n=1 Tax=Pseudonocardia hierapolitana TaxID=1128676 RepID=UPI0011BE52F0|nr:hypothetical protein [Pseudonocardia hierapolitana]